MSTSPDLGRLMRLRGSISATATEQKIEPSDAPSLTEGYGRMRSQVAGLVAGGPLEAEFEEMFPELPVFEQSPDPTGGRGLIAWHTAATTAATNAQRLLGQMAGWVDGLIEEQTLPQRLQADAAEKAKLEHGGLKGI